jgi:hypothetical protein
MLKHKTMMAYGEVEEKCDAFLTSALDGEWSASHSGHFTTREKAPGIHWRGALVDPESVWMQGEERKIPVPVKDQIPFILSIANSLTDSYSVSQKAGNPCTNTLKHEVHLYLYNI